MKYLLLLISTLAHLHISTLIYAQYTQEKEYGLWAGSATYFGDLNISNSFISTRPAGGLIFRRNFTNPYFSFKSGLNVGLLKFDDTNNKYLYQKTRDLRFSTILIELSSQIEFNFFEFKIDEPAHRFTPYLYAGMGIFYFNYKDSYEKSYSPVQPSILYGFGMKKNISRFTNIGFEFGNRKTFTDYIDGISTIYSDNFNPFGINKKQRGDRQKNDSYLFLAVSVTWVIRKTECPYPPM